VSGVKSSQQLTSGKGALGFGLGAFLTWATRIAAAKSLPVLAPLAAGCMNRPLDLVIVRDLFVHFAKSVSSGGSIFTKIVAGKVGDLEQLGHI